MEIKTYYIEFVKSCSRQNRTDFMKMLLSNLTVSGVLSVQNVAQRLKKKGKFAKDASFEFIQDDEDGWWELPRATEIMDFAGYTNEENLIGFIKLVLGQFGKDEISYVRSSMTHRARDNILHPERAVPRPRSVPALVGWWEEYGSDILAVDCEFVHKIIGKKRNGGNRCAQLAGTVSVCNFDQEVVYSKVIYHHPSEVYLTKHTKEITGFKENSFVNGTKLQTVQDELRKLFEGKLLILCNAGSDFNALQMNKGDFDVFDLHEYYHKDGQAIGLRSIVLHYMKIDIHTGVHTADEDAKYTMAVFRYYYIPEKIKSSKDLNLRSSVAGQSHIARVK